MNNPQRKLRKQFHLQKLPKNKILRNKFTKELQDLYTENYKKLLKEIKEHINKWKDIHVHGLEDLILWQYSPNCFTDSA